MSLRIIHADVIEGLAQLEDGSARCVVTSPPYWGLRDYGIPPSTWPDGWVGCLGLEPTRYRSGNKARKFRADHGGVSEDLQRGHQGMSVPWDDNGQRNRRTVWTIPTQPFAEAHFATFPEALAEPCIRAGSAPGDLVLDPFGGAGTTGVVALRLGRRCTLIELSSSSVDIARRRINGPLFAKLLA